MSGKGKKLQEALCRYTTDTLSYINTVRGFCHNISIWMFRRKTELEKMKEIKDRADRMNLKLSHIKHVKKNLKAMKDHMKSKMTLKSAESKRADLVKELEGALELTLKGLKELDCFLDAVEKLAVTSLHVFMEENQVLHLPKGISLKQVQVVIAAAQLTCPLLLEFKRDASVFFLPKLQNVEVLSYQLDKYIQTTQNICDTLLKSCVSDFDLKMTKETVVDLDEDLSEDDTQNMLRHINQLDELRMNQHFRMVFLFHEASCSDFIREFSERQPRMLQFLKDLEETAVQLDSMNMGAKISSVVGRSVSAVGGVLSIVGLALIPFTAGVSTGLIIGGTAMAVTSGANSLFTTATEIGVNSTQKKKADEVFQSFMDDVKVLQDCLEEITSQTLTSKIDVAVEVGKALNKVRGIGAGCMDLVDDVAFAGNLLKGEELIKNVGKVGQEGKALRNVAGVAAEVPDIGEAVVKGPLGFSKAARVGFIALNALFIGMDVFFICKDSISLAKGSKTEASQFIRARAKLWSSQIDSWQKMHDSLNEGLPTSEKHRAVLDKPFYPEREI